MFVNMTVNTLSICSNFTGGLNKLVFQLLKIYFFGGGGGLGFGEKTEGSSTIMSTSFALKFWSNKIIDVDIILFVTLTASQKLVIRFNSGQNLC